MATPAAASRATPTSSRYAQCAVHRDQVKRFCFVCKCRHGAAAAGDVSTYVPFQDVMISTDGSWALSGSWDGTMRLWDLAGRQPTRRFVHHTKDILSVAFSMDNRQIISGGRDKVCFVQGLCVCGFLSHHELACGRCSRLCCDVQTIKLWNTLGYCKYTIGSSATNEDGHSEWVSCVRFSPSAQNQVIVSCGWDKLVKVWNLSSCKLQKNLVGHSGYLNCVTVSPDGECRSLVSSCFLLLPNCVHASWREAMF